jgi:hypothetical protein
MNPMDPIKGLRDAIDAALADLELERVTFTLVPGEGPVPDTIALLLKVNGDIFKTSEQRQIDSEFDNMMKKMDLADREQQKIQEIQEMISDWMEED